MASASPPAKYETLKKKKKETLVSGELKVNTMIVKLY